MGQLLNHWSHYWAFVSEDAPPLSRGMLLHNMWGFGCLCYGAENFFFFRPRLRQTDRQTHLLLRMFFEMKHGHRDTYFLLLIKKVCLLRAYWIRHGYQQCMPWQTLILGFANHQLNCQHKYYNTIFKVYDFCGRLYSISAANWLWLHKPALFQYRITGNIFIIYWIATRCLLVFHRLLRSAIYFLDSLEIFMHNE